MSLFKEKNWRIVGFNAENLFVYLDESPSEDLSTMTEEAWQKLSKSTVRNKSITSLREIARMIQDLDPDFILLCEIGGTESLENFSRYFLSDLYAPFLVEGNSNRGIDVGFLVKRSLPLRYELVSHKNRPLEFLYPHEKQSLETGYESEALAKTVSNGHRFSRDVVELRCYDARAHESSRPEFVLMSVHLKSPLDQERIDPEGRDRRRAELEMLMRIYDEVAAEFSTEPNDVPILIGGDFNGVVFGEWQGAEFERLRASDLRCCLELA
ncbi:MAG: hypothetical protein RBT63_05595, partial [Bdellovibrionales bacterium]|nr:hypothetical protein [Bdellovibrionales bacterium]